MRATELRIGNLIQQGEITMIASGNVWIGNDIFLTDEIEPIPLTEEWLLKFGFLEYMSKSDLRISISAGVLMQFHFGVNQIECWIGDEISKTDIIYVNQLQNLYFALTNKEL